MSVNPKESPIRYEFDGRPETGDTMTVAPGVHWLRMFLPFSLSHINLWLLKDGDAWSIVDTGVNVDECHQTWDRTIGSVLGGKAPSRIIVTHLHPDHIGCAGWLSERFGIPLWMTRSEYLMARILVADTERQAPDEGARFYRGAGFEARSLDYYHQIFGMFGKFVHPLPQSYRRIKDGDVIDIGDHQWEIIVGRGHSPEHACLYCAELNQLISGDQLLPTISSNVSVFPTEPEANPLKDWMESLGAMKPRIPADVLVLPAHGKPFRGAHERIDALIDEHQDGLRKLEDICHKPRRAIDTFPALFKAKIDRKNLIMATGEAIAHLNYLRKEGRMSARQDEDGVNWYTTS